MRPKRRAGRENGGIRSRNRIAIGSGKNAPVLRSKEGVTKLDVSP
jgi:hypothetical protein